MLLLCDAEDAGVGDVAGGGADGDSLGHQRQSAGCRLKMDHWSDLLNMGRKTT